MKQDLLFEELQPDGKGPAQPPDFSPRPLPESVQNAIKVLADYAGSPEKEWGLISVYVRSVEGQLTMTSFRRFPIRHVRHEPNVE